LRRNRLFFFGEKGPFCLLGMGGPEKGIDDDGFWGGGNTAFPRKKNEGGRGKQVWQAQGTPMRNLASERDKKVGGDLPRTQKGNEREPSSGQE